SEYSVPVLGLIFLRYADHKFTMAKQELDGKGADIGKAINESMRAIEAENEELKDILPKTYNHLDNSTLVELLKTFNSVPMDIEGDAFGKIYEYFLGKFAMSEGQKGGEFFMFYECIAVCAINKWHIHHLSINKRLLHTP
ncbi:MAG TPA: N-6 DNA methylase, partial [Candidatus Methanoperedens sp.]